MSAPTREQVIQLAGVVRSEDPAFAVSELRHGLDAAYAQGRADALREPSGSPECRYCGADCSEGRSWDGGDLYACGPCADARADENRGEPSGGEAS